VQECEVDVWGKFCGAMPYGTHFFPGLRFQRGLSARFSVKQQLLKLFFHEKDLDALSFTPFPRKTWP
jgi:hypothetical protein